MSPPRYWDDSAYSQFYEKSGTEKSLVNSSTPQDEQLSAKDLDLFQGTFAEWSEGRKGLRSQDFRPFLQQLGIRLSPEQARSLWKHHVQEGQSLLPPDEALLAFRSVKYADLRTPLRFLPNPAAAAKERYERGGGGDIQARVLCNPEPLEAALPGTSVAGGLKLPFSEVLALLKSEEIPPYAIEDFLGPYQPKATRNMSTGLVELGPPEGVPQSKLFDFLAFWACTLEDPL
eukprot:CAMPEP_0206430796 /NCGR_PEP_ID=MMETSP0324_2-20121206/7013_1 /ASSEMBLY_ACC=CAM_ASM_000836 /TAXON_ID=2866 /ORGANISM="Crypthecodinium cohnii, Strain Seligo" /LENGTH=230 /DNA_ID=CAMNT_0053896663 /DNA_START=38 /DNA_END=730 /DNA_ORIENTATION=-